MLVAYVMWLYKRTLVDGQLFTTTKANLKLWQQSIGLFASENGHHAAQVFHVQYKAATLARAGRLDRAVPAPVSWTTHRLLQVVVWWNSTLNQSISFQYCTCQWIYNEPVPEWYGSCARALDSWCAWEWATDWYDPYGCHHRSADWTRRCTKWGCAGVALPRRYGQRTHRPIYCPLQQRSGTRCHVPTWSRTVAQMAEQLFGGLLQSTKYN